jgi:hypothetical protein
MGREEIEGAIKNIFHNDNGFPCNARGFAQYALMVIPTNVVEDQAEKREVKGIVEERESSSISLDEREISHAHVDLINADDMDSAIRQKAPDMASAAPYVNES